MSRRDLVWSLSVGDDLEGPQNLWCRDIFDDSCHWTKTIHLLVQFLLQVLPLRKRIHNVSPSIFPHQPSYSTSSYLVTIMHITRFHLKIPHICHTFHHSILNRRWKNLFEVKVGPIFNEGFSKAAHSPSSTISNLLKPECNYLVTMELGVCRLQSECLVLWLVPQCNSVMKNLTKGITFTLFYHWR